MKFKVKDMIKAHQPVGIGGKILGESINLSIDPRKRAEMKYFGDTVRKKWSKRVWIYGLLRTQHLEHGRQD